MGWNQGIVLGCVWRPSQGLTWKEGIPAPSKKIPNDNALSLSPKGALVLSPCHTGFQLESTSGLFKPYYTAIVSCCHPQKNRKTAKKNVLQRTLRFRFRLQVAAGDQQHWNATEDEKRIKQVFY